ncbi:MAG: hypothetical protein HY056_01310 [Proteobacteria bacterium]|nr:hypothetical protein [Pseudomonadota bacterium]
MRKLIISLSALVALVMAAPPLYAIDLTVTLAKLYTDVSALPPTAERMMVCYGFVCRRRTWLDFTTADRRKLTELLAAGKASAQAEREAVRKAVVWFDRRVGPIIGTDKRIARADFRYFADRNNYDCFDTTRNTTSLLLVLQEWGLLRHHGVGEPRYRGNFLFGQTPHNTAILIERTGGRAWVVDMWTRAYAQMPEVMLAEIWVKQD